MTFRLFFVVIRLIRPVDNSQQHIKSARQMTDRTSNYANHALHADRHLSKSANSI